MDAWEMAIDAREEISPRSGWAWHQASEKGWPPRLAARRLRPTMARAGAALDKPKPPRQGRGTPSLPLRRLRPALDRNNAHFPSSVALGFILTGDSPAACPVCKNDSSVPTGCRHPCAKRIISMNSAVMRQGASKSPAAHGLADGRRPERIGGHARPGQHGPSSRRAAPQRGDGFPLFHRTQCPSPGSPSQALPAKATRQSARNACPAENSVAGAAQRIRAAEARHRGQRRPSARTR